MQLRQHLEIAVLVSRFSSSPQIRSVAWFGPLRRRFWNHVAYLIHLWVKAQWEHASTGRRSELSGSNLAEEVMAIELLSRVVASAERQLAERMEDAVGTLEDQVENQRHARQLEEVRINCLETLSGSAALRLQRVQRWLEQWGDFLAPGVNSKNAGGGASDLALPVRPGGRYVEEAYWSLLQRGVVQSLPSKQVTDPVRVAVHRTLQNLACSLIPADSFLPDGQVKPSYLQRFRVNTTVLS